MNRLALPVLVALACAACSKPPAPVQEPPAPQARVQTPWDSLQAQKKKAQDVQNTVDAQAKAQDAALRAQEQ